MLSRTCGDNKILYFVGWIRRDFNLHDKPISFDSRRSPPAPPAPVAPVAPPASPQSQQET